MFYNLSNLSGLNRSAKSSRIAGQRTAFTTLWVGHQSAVLAPQVHFAKLCSFPTWSTELRLDHL